MRLLFLLIVPGFLLGQVPREVTLDDGTGMRTWTVSPPSPSGNSPGNYSLHLKGEIATPQNRRLLSRRIHLEMDGSVPAAYLAKAAGATSFQVPHYSKKDLIVTLPNPGDSLAKLARIQTLPGVRSARPLLSQRRSPRLVPNDPRFAWKNSNTAYQWHLNNTGQNGSTTGLDVNVVEVWDSFLGEGVTVSVVDDGLQISHEDLTDNVNTDIDHDWNDATPDDPTPPLNQQPGGYYFSHGTNVAGVIAGRGNNNIGISGAAPRAQLVGLKILAGAVSPAEEAEALAWRTDVIDISNNSWGTPDDGFTLYKTDPLIVAALQNSVSNGRGGKGTIYVWSAGNGRAEKDYANYDGFVNQPETIAVGSVTFEEKQSYYSESGANVLISAPSDGDHGDPAIITTTLTSQGSYTNSFGGTSSAAPLVSGVIALVLEANPNLGWRDVQEILIQSARKVNPTHPGWTTNGAGFHFHHGFGAGMIDAAAGVTLASNWNNLGTRTSRLISAPTINQTIPDDSPSGTTHTFIVDGENLRVEHVVLTVDIEHSYRGDLAISLTSPDGTVSHLSESHDDDGSDYDEFPLLSVRHWGESANGTWTLKIVDAEAGDTGTLKSASLKLHGASPPPSPSYDTWVSENFSPQNQSNETIAGPLADPDNDGRTNLIEYAFDGNPNAPEAALPHEPAILEINNQKRLRFTRDNSKTDLTYTLKSSPSLSGNWQTVPTSFVSTDDTLEVRELLLNSPSKRFFRIEISR